MKSGGERYAGPRLEMSGGADLEDEWERGETKEESRKQRELVHFHNAPRKSSGNGGKTYDFWRERSEKMLPEPGRISKEAGVIPDRTGSLEEVLRDAERILSPR